MVLGTAELARAHGGGTMKVFLSWSGTASQQIAERLREWLPLILQPVQPFLTSNDIEKGARWSGEIGKELEQCNFGIVCLTRENLNSQWMAFEAGALSKQLSSRVATALFGISQQDVKPPLALFQGTQFNEQEFRKLLGSINAALPVEQQRDDADINKLFSMLWPDLKAGISNILERQPETGPAPAPDYPAMVVELLGLARQQASMLASPERLLEPVMERVTDVLKHMAERQEYLLMVSERTRSSENQLAERFWEQVKSGKFAATLSEELKKEFAKRFDITARPSDEPSPSNAPS